MILAVKPQDLDALLAQLRGHVAGKLVVSVAAGITTGYIQRHSAATRVVRAMPNLPAKIGKGMICLCKGAAAADLDFVKKLFDYMGKTMIMEEEMINAATAISGSGPGYFYYLIKDRQRRQWQDYAVVERPSILESCWRKPIK